MPRGDSSQADTDHGRLPKESNRMPILADTTVIPQSLEALFELLHRELN